MLWVFLRSDYVSFEELPCTFRGDQSAANEQVITFQTPTQPTQHTTKWPRPPATTRQRAPFPAKKTRTLSTLHRRGTRRRNQLRSLELLPTPQTKRAWPQRTLPPLSPFPIPLQHTRNLHHAIVHLHLHHLRRPLRRPCRRTLPSCPFWQCARAVPCAFNLNPQDPRNSIPFLALRVDTKIMCRILQSRRRGRRTGLREGGKEARQRREPTRSRWRRSITTF